MPPASSPPRLFVPEPSAYDGSPAELPPEEARHVVAALRGKVGDAVELFDGAGRRAPAVLDAVAKRRVTVRVVAEPSVTPPPNDSVTLAVAAPKGDRFRWLVEKATELGVDRLRLLKTERTVVEPGGAKLDKAAATVVAACKQSGRDRLMTIEPAVEWSALLSEHHVGTAWIASPTADGSTASVPAGPFLCAIGPEGGFSESEIAEAAAAGWRAVSLGPRVLRIETAAIAVASLASVRPSGD